MEGLAAALASVVSDTSAPEHARPPAAEGSAARAALAKLLKVPTAEHTVGYCWKGSATALRVRTPAAEARASRAALSKLLKVMAP